MSRTPRTLVLISAAALALGSSAFAKGSGSLHLSSNATIGGTAVQAGDYKISWSDTGDLSVKQGKKVVATAKATVEQQARKAARTEVLSRTKSDGNAEVLSIQLENSNQVLVLDKTVAQNKTD